MKFPVFCKEPCCIEKSKSTYTNNCVFVTQVLLVLKVNKSPYMRHIEFSVIRKTKMTLGLGGGVIWLVRCYPKLVWLITAAVCSVHRKWRLSKAHPWLGHCKLILSHAVVEIPLSVLLSSDPWSYSMKIQCSATKWSWAVYQLCKVSQTHQKK